MSEPQQLAAPLPVQVLAESTETVSPALSSIADPIVYPTITSTKAPPTKIPAAHSAIPTIASAAASKTSGIKPPTATATRIGRPCCQGHTAPKAGPPPLENKNESNMRRQGDEYSRSHLSDVYEESEADLVTEQRPPPRSPRSTKSRSPDGSGTSSKARDGSMNSELYMEATGRRRSSDHSVVLTSDTDSFIIGQRIWVGGIRPGHIAYIGETHFAPGDWAGIVLDDPNGKNDGCVSGIRYFQCEAKRGIFSRLTRLTREQIVGTSASDMSMNLSSVSMMSPGRSGTVSPTHSMLSYSSKAPSKSNLAVGDRVIVSSGLGSKPGILKYIGETKFATGNWCGVMLDEATGKNDGSVDGQIYFECPVNFGIFVPLAKVSLSPLSRKVRLSRSGSRESLTSVGTVGTHASTATSRLRMSAQRLSTSAKPLTSPKSTFSLQDILREKQNHIEQLLNERDLDRLENENQVLKSNKDINQLKETIATLEQRLSNESRKAEDLQVSIEEANFCGDELSAQTQEYKERIAKLEAQLSAANASSTFADTDKAENVKLLADIERLTAEVAAKSFEITVKSAELESLQTAHQQCLADLAAETERLAQAATDYNIKLSSLGVSEQCLREEINYLSSENEQLKTELRNKDESTEKEYLSMKNIEHELKEELAAVHGELKLREASLASNDGELHKIVRQKDETIAELKRMSAETMQANEALVAQKAAELEQLQSTVHETTQAHQSLIKEQANLMATVEMHVKTIIELQSIIKDSSQVVTTLQDQRDEQQSAYELSLKMLDEQKEIIAKTSVDTDELLAKHSALASSFKELEVENQNLIGSVLPEKDGRIEELHASTIALAEQLNELKNQRLRFENDLIARDQQLGEKEAILTELQDKFNDVITTNTALQKELSDFTSNLHSKDDIVSSLSQRLHELDGQVTEKNAEIVSLKAAHIAKNDQYEVLSKEQTDLIQQIAQLQQQHEQTVSQLTEKTQNLVDIQQQKLSDDSKIADMNGNIESLRREIAKHLGENGEFKDRLAATVSALEVAQTDIAHKNDAINDTRRQTEKLQQDCGDKIVDLEKAHKAIADVTEKLKFSEALAGSVQAKLSHLEVEHEDLKRKMTITEHKTEALTQEKMSLQLNLDALQCSSSDTNTEIRRLTDELQLKQKTYDEMVDKANDVQLTIERKLHELTQNLSARTTQWERVKEEMDTLTTQKIDRENELNLELSKIKEASEAERRALANEIAALRVSFAEETERVANEVVEKLKHAEMVRNELNANVLQLEKTVAELQQDIEVSRNQLQVKDKEVNDKLQAFEEVEGSIRRELEEMKAAESKLMSSLDDSTRCVEEERRGLTAKLTEQQQLVAEYNQKISDLSSQLELGHVALKTCQTQVLDVTGERDALKASAEAESARLSNVIVEMEAKHVCLTQQFQSNEDDQVDLVNKNLELIETLTLVRQQLSEADERNQITVESSAKLHFEYEAIKTASETLKIDLERSVQKTEAISAEKDRTIQSMDEQVQKLNVALQENTAQLNGMQQTLHTHQSAYEAYKTEVQSQLIAEAAKCQSLADDTAAKQKIINALEDKIAQLTSSVNLSDDLKNELNHKSEELRTKDSSIAELNGSIVTLQQQLHTRDDALKRIADERQADSQRSLDSHQERLLEINHLQEKIEKLERSLQSQTEQTTSSHSKAAALLSDTERLAKENDALNELIAAQQQEFQTRMLQYEERSKFEALQGELELMERVKRQEVERLTQKLEATEKQVLGQSASMERLDAMQRKEKDLVYEKTVLERREKELMAENKLLANKLVNMKASSMEHSKQTVSSTVVDDDETGAQISFLNSIIADMQKKNESLTHRITALEAMPADFMNINGNFFDVPVRRQPAPRLFCDICDEFDGHDTEDCPLQSSDSPPSHVETAAPAVPLLQADGRVKERKVPPPRKYCDSCEEFGHETTECTNEQTY